MYFNYRKTSIYAGSNEIQHNIIAKMIEGRLRNFFSQCVLLEQPFVKDDKQTVGQLATAAGLQVKRLENWRIGG